MQTLAWRRWSHLERSRSAGTSTPKVLHSVTIMVLVVAARRSSMLPGMAPFLSSVRPPVAITVVRGVPVTAVPVGGIISRAVSVARTVAVAAPIAMIVGTGGVATAMTTIAITLICRQSRPADECESCDSNEILLHDPSP